MLGKTRFSMERVAAGNKRARMGGVPKLSELLLESTPVKPSLEITQKLGQSQLVVGIDIETNDFVDGRKPSCIGRFGHHCWCGDDDLQFRLVQIGWVTGGSAKNATIHTREEHLVLAQDFTISEKATKKHGITNELARTNGLPLEQVLEKFMQAVWSLHEAGGVVVSHHIEFDSGVIDEELRRCGMEQWRARWHTLASKGICTLDLNIQDWFQSACGRFKGPGERTLVMNLKDSVMLFYANCAHVKELVKKAHTAGADAELHVLLYQALRELAMNSM